MEQFTGEKGDCPILYRSQEEKSEVLSNFLSDVRNNFGKLRIFFLIKVSTYSNVSRPMIFISDIEYYLKSVLTYSDSFHY